MITPELARAWEQYFKEKGGRTPRAGADVLPVVVMEPASPYPASRVWQFGYQVAAVAAQYSSVGVQNADPTDQRSIVVVDWVILRPLAAMDVYAWITTVANLPITGVRPVSDIAQEKDALGVDRPQLGNVTGGYNQSASFFGQDNIPFNDTLPRRIDGPWTLGSKEVLYFTGSAPNTALHGYFHGRYYPAA